MIEINCIDSNIEWLILADEDVIFKNANVVYSIINKMEENETDIINNRIIQETINRQEEILSKLLEADDARREQDKDQKRESTEWEFQIDYKNSDFIDYQKQKNSQNEMLKTVPLQLNPFYKKKVKKYFQNMTND